ncbi:MAG TPA: M81 family metallopeptidase [Planctomycetota bacterium]|nr:M81 family metallopeptidase [Planctomycetota bacterium]
MRPIHRAARIVVASLSHESNGFVAGTTPSSAFRVRSGCHLLRSRGDGSALDGALDGVESRGWIVVPGIAMDAWPSPPAEDGVLDAFVDAMAAASALGDSPDGVLLCMHGAMMTASHVDAEGEALVRLRRLPRLADIPIVACFDLHGNPSAAMCAALDAVVACRRNPHDDLRESGRRAADILARLIEERRRGRCVVAHVGAMWAPIGTATAEEPMRSLEAAARSAEAADGSILEAAVFAGFAYADHADVGVAACVSTIGSEDAARATADALADLAWTRRGEGDRIGMRWDAALDAIRAAGAGPVVVAETADNIGAGARGDATGLLRLLLDHDVGGEVLASLADAAAVADLASAGPSARVRLPLGGRGWTGDAPIERLWTVESVGEAVFRLEDPSSPLAALCGQRADAGPSAVVRHGRVRVVVTSRAIPAWDLGFWRCHGLEPALARVVAVKGAVAHRRAYDAIAASHIAVETPGPCPTALRGVPYRRLRRPMHPLDGVTARRAREATGGPPPSP